MKIHIEQRKRIMASPCGGRTAYSSETAAQAGARVAETEGDTSTIVVVAHGAHYHWRRLVRLDNVRRSRLQKLSERVRRVRRHRLAG